MSVPYRLIMYWEDSDNGRHFLTTASVLVTRKRYIRDVKTYSCLATKQVKTPAAVYFPINHNHYLLWQEPARASWAIGGELLQGESCLSLRLSECQRQITNKACSVKSIDWGEQNLEDNGVQFQNNIRFVGWQSKITFVVNITTTRGIHGSTSLIPSDKCRKHKKRWKFSL